MSEITNQEVMEAVTALRAAAEGNQAEFKAMQEKIEPMLNDMEAKNQELVQKLADEEKRRAETEERLVTVEKEMLDKTAKKTFDYKETPEYKALEIYCKNGVSHMDGEQKQLLRTDDATQGGYLTMPEMDNMIIKSITEISPVRAVARVRSTGSKTLEIPVRTNIPTAEYEGEAAESPTDTSEYGLESVTAYRLTVTTPFTRDMMMDSEFDLENEIMGDVAEAFAQAEGRGFVIGTGAKQPEGFLSSSAGLQPTIANGGRSRISTGPNTAGGTWARITADDLILLTGDLKVGYQPYYGFNRRGLAAFRTFKGSDDQYLWQLGLGGGAPNTIAGFPYVLLEDMPDSASGTYSVVFADFMRGYTIIDRTGMEIIRDEVTRKKQAIIELTFHRWNTGQVVLPEAFVLLQSITT